MEGTRRGERRKATAAGSTPPPPPVQSPSGHPGLTRAEPRPPGPHHAPASRCEHFGGATGACEAAWLVPPQEEKLARKCPEGSHVQTRGGGATERPREGPARWACVPGPRQRPPSSASTPPYPPLSSVASPLPPRTPVTRLGPIGLIQDEGTSRYFVGHVCRDRIPKDALIYGFSGRWGAGALGADTRPRRAAVGTDLAHLRERAPDAESPTPVSKAGQVGQRGVCCEAKQARCFVTENVPG